jgi:hypothetical protein
MPNTPTSALSRPLRRTLAGLFAASLVTLLAACGRGGPDQYSWHGPVAPGAWVRVRNVNGAIRVARSSGNEAVITATRTYHGRRPEPVRMITEQHGADVVACVTWGDSNRCDSRSRWRQSFLLRILRRYAPTEMTFVVALPAGVRLEAATVNGRVTVADAPDEVVVSSVNGSITLGATGGPVKASTVNGGVAAELDSLGPDARVSLESVNGSVTALLPRAANASLDLSTVNGRLTADFPGVTIARGARALHATLGTGGPAVSLHTVNGSVRAQPLR